MAIEWVCLVMRFDCHRPLVMQTCQLGLGNASGWKVKISVDACLSCAEKGCVQHLSSSTT